MTANFASGTVWTGDNLAVMRGMNSACVDLIYLDPPFNSNRHYEAPIGSKAAGAAFKDAWTLDDVDVCEHGELADRNPAAYSVIEAARQAHGKGMQSYLIMMAVRLLEMRRILKPTGSIYLHCDDAAGHWLRVLMDGIFGKSAFRNEIVWKRIGNHNDAGRFGRTGDRLLFYGADIRRRGVRIPLSDDNVRSKYRHEDERGRYRRGDLTGPKTSDGEAGQSWRGWSPTDIGRCWSVPKTGDYAAWIEANLIPGYRAEESILARLDKLHDADLIEFTANGTPELKRYLAANPGQVPPDVWTDIPPVNSQAKERTGYPTQKPLALLDRIIRASSREGDMVLDPFCGCATACVAADRLQREWAGIDLSPLAVKLVDERIAEDRGGLKWGGATVPDRPPVRTDLGDLPNYRTHRHRLYGEQEGVCAGCETHFPFRVMDVDHMLPKSRGGTDHPDNLQLLCSGCNRSKGGKTMAEWRAAQ
ncbi:MAG: DNA methyltransferase [Deltaproteobacteria bacterium]|nr:DNA methyltransferase [Deltaproteobacteria bacterium]